jgi:hypothetical protein
LYYRKPNPRDGRPHRYRVSVYEQPDFIDFKGRITRSNVPLSYIEDLGTLVDSVTFAVMPAKNMRSPRGYRKLSQNSGSSLKRNNTAANERAVSPRNTEMRRERSQMNRARSPRNLMTNASSPRISMTRVASARSPNRAANSPRRSRSQSRERGGRNDNLSRSRSQSRERQNRSPRRQNQSPGRRSRSQSRERTANNEIYFIEGSPLSEKEMDYCRCLPHVAAQQSKACLNNPNLAGQMVGGKKCYNPYAVCAKSVGTSTGRKGCTSFYNFEKDGVPDDEVIHLAYLHNKPVPRPYDREKLAARLQGYSD